MRIFLSYASERKPVAEPVAISLRNRGHQVFFDDDDLPAGRSYDERIEQAIADADFFVFLISPESVAQGRYTLTELGFARQKWPRPDGNVLPVLIAPTDFPLVPAFLRGVDFLEPSGNIAAEVGAAIARITKPPARRRIVPVAILSGMVSGLLAWAVPIVHRDVPAPAGLFDFRALDFILIKTGHGPISAPIFFALGLSGWVWFFLRPPLVALVASLFPAVFAGWLLAVNLVFYVAIKGAGLSGDEMSVTQIFLLVALGVIGGGVGGIFTWTGAAIIVRQLRQSEAALLTTMVAAVAGGVFFYPGAAVGWGEGDAVQIWVLLAPWQAAVAGSLAWSISREGHNAEKYRYVRAR